MGIELIKKIVENFHSGTFRMFKFVLYWAWVRRIVWVFLLTIFFFNNYILLEILFFSLKTSSVEEIEKMVFAKLWLFIDLKNTEWCNANIIQDDFPNLFETVIDYYIYFQYNLISMQKIYYILSLFSFIHTKNFLSLISSLLRKEEKIY